MFHPLTWRELWPVLQPPSRGRLWCFGFTTGSSQVVHLLYSLWFTKVSYLHVSDCTWQKPVWTFSAICKLVTVPYWGLAILSGTTEASTSPRNNAFFPIQNALQFLFFATIFLIKVFVIKEYKKCRNVLLRTEHFRLFFRLESWVYQLWVYRNPL